MKRIKRLSILLMLPMLVMAESQAMDKEKLKTQIESKIPGLKIEQIDKSPLTGFYQATFGGQVIQISEDGRFIITGDVVELKGDSRINITEDARRAIRVKKMAGFGNKNFIQFAPKDPKYTVTMFTDISCGYCRKFHETIDKVNELGIAIQYIPYPRNGLDSDTAKQMQSMWCAKDKKTALNQGMQDKYEGKAECDNQAVKLGFEMGQQLGINATPTMVLPDGTLVPGYLPPEKLAEVLAALKNQS